MNPADRAITDAELITMFSGDIPDTTGYYLDANIDQQVAELLRQSTIRLTDAYDQQQAAERSDIRVLARARQIGCIMVTKDLDFVEIDSRIGAIDELSHLGVLLVTSTLKYDPVQCAAALRRIAEKYEGWPDLLRNQVFTI
jgi:predicted nuclease of predicted toxin-antitoxin system